MIDLGSMAGGIVRSADGSHWIATGAHEPISYSADDSQLYAALEESSFWFAHRNQAIAAAVARFPPRGPLFDVGGGNGFVARELAGRGYETVLVEPSAAGVEQAVRRGLTNVVRGTLAAARFHPRTMGGAGLFDVVEHIDDDVAFLRALRPLLMDGAPLYLTVPAFRWLWSVDDRAAGHYRRYRRSTLAAALNAAGFDVVYATYFFAPLVAPIFLLRARPSLLGIRKQAEAECLEREHSGGLARRFLDPLFAAERRRIERGRTLPFGASILAVARVILPA